MSLAICPVCGENNFDFKAVIWDSLIEAWELSEEEIAYINRQQGFHCLTCVNNLRAMALADSIRRNCAPDDTSLLSAIEAGKLDLIRILEVNHAGGLTAYLEKLPMHRLVSYPEFDLCDLDLEDNQFDLVIHSDTLEHVEDPVQGLRECHRVLKPGGQCIFTVPIVVSRLSRSRAGLANSYHGAESSREQDLLVRTEFGSDTWEYVLRAGFRSCMLHSIEYPAGLAIQAYR